MKTNLILQLPNLSVKINNQSSYFNSDNTNKMKHKFNMVLLKSVHDQVKKMMVLNNCFHCHIFGCINYLSVVDNEL